VLLPHHALSPKHQSIFEKGAHELSRDVKILGQSKIGPKYRITLVKNVAKRLDVKEGDTIIFTENERGEIVLKTVSQTELLKLIKR